MPNFLFADAIYAVPLNIIIWSICIGANIGFLYNFYSRNIIGSLVRKLLALGVGEENAKTMSELGYKRFTLFHKVILKDGSYLRNIVHVAGGAIPQATNEEGALALDWDNARFYIPESKLSKAKGSYGAPQKWIFLPIFIALSILLSVAMIYIMPFLIENLPLL